MDEKDDLTYDDAFKDLETIINKNRLPRLYTPNPKNKQKGGMSSLVSHMESIYRGEDTGFGKSRYDEGMNWDVSVDSEDIQGSINEFRAQNQPWLHKAGAGLGRVTTKVVAEVAKMPGFIGGALAAPFAEEGEGWDTFVNNSWIKAINEANQNINEDILPVYVKKAVREGNLWDHISSVDFWATEGADGVGYIVSMMVPGAVLKGLGAGKYLSKIKPLQGTLSAQKADVITATVANTLFEAGTEAGNAMENFQKEMDRKLSAGEITPQQYEEMKQQKALLGRDIFLANAVILVGPNALQTNMLWGKGLNKSMAKIADGGEGALGKMVVEPKLYQKVLNRGKNIASASLSEATWEEAMQSTVEGMFSESASKGELGNNPLYDFNLNELGNAYLDTVTSTEGQKAMFLGAFLGGGMSAYHGAKSDIADRKSTQSLLDAGNNAIDAFYKTMTADIYDENGKRNESKVKEKFEAFGRVEQLNLMYNEAVQRQDKEALEKLRDLAATQLAYGFIMNEDLGLDVLQQHLEASSQFDEIVQREQDAGNKTTKKDIIDNVMSKARVLEKAYTNFNDFSASLIDPTLKEGQTEQQVVEFTNTLRGNYISNKANINLNEESLKKLKEQRSNVLKDLGLSPELVIGDETIVEQEQSDARLKQVNKDIIDIETNLKRLKKLDRNFWNQEHIQKAFDRRSKELKAMEKATTPEIQNDVESIDNAIKNATTLEELEKIDYQNNSVLKKNYNAKKLELEEALRSARETIVDNDKNRKDSENLDKELNTDTVKDYASNKKINDVVIDPFTNKESTIESISKNKIALRDNETQQTFYYEIPEDISDDISADDIDVTTVNPVTGGTTQTDHKTVGYDNNNESFATYLMEPRNKKGDVVTFEINKTTATTKESAKAIEIVEKRDNLAGNRQFLIDYLPINFIYNNGQAKSWSAFKGPNAVKLRTNIVDALIQGNTLEDLRTVVTNQETPSFNTKFENNKPVKNNPLNVDYIKTLGKNPENNITLYHVNKLGDLILVSNNKNPLTLSTSTDLSSQKGQIFMGIKNPKGDNVPVKLNFSKLNNAKASVLAKIYSDLLIDESLRNANVSVFKMSNPGLFNEITKVLSSELELLGNNPATISTVSLIETLVYEDSSNDKSIVFKKDDNGNNYIDFNNKIYTVDNVDQLAIDLQEKFHNVITITADTNINKTLNFSNPKYLKYLFDNGIVTTNLETEGFAFKQSTNTKANDISKNKGSELWISSTIENINKPVKKTTVQQSSNNIKEVTDTKIKEFNTKISEILSKRKEGQDTVNAPEFIMDNNGKFIEFDNVAYTDEGIITEDGLVTYDILEQEIKNTVKNNLSSVSKNIKPVVTQTATTSKPQQSDIEAKKADIERRREEELKSWLPSDVIKINEQANQVKDVPENPSKDASFFRKVIKPIIDSNRTIFNEIAGLLYYGINSFKSNNETYKIVSNKTVYKEIVRESDNKVIATLSKGDFQGNEYEVLDILKNIQPTVSSETTNRINAKYDTELAALENKNNLENNVQIIEYKNNSYSVNLDKGTIKNTKTGKEIQGSSPVGKKVLDLVNWDVENNLENIRNSQNNSVSLQDNPVISNKMDIEGTPENKDYKEAFKNLEVKGDNLVKMETLEQTLNKAKKSVETMAKIKPELVSKFEKIVKDTEQELINLAKQIRKDKKC